jgi:hypothetical protein
VIALLEAVGLVLVKRHEWPERDEDVAQNLAIAADHEKAFRDRNGGVLSPDDTERIVFMRFQAKAVRFRPDETAASASIDPVPASFVDAVEAAKVLLTEYDRTFPPTAPPTPPP